MADNVAITAGAGTTVATDDVAGVHYQRVKLVNGTLDATDAIPGDAANGLDVDVTRVQGTVTVDSELTTADLDTGAGTDTRAVVGIAGAASGGAVLVQATAGGLLKVDASGQAVPITDNGGSVTVDGTVAADLNAGTNLIGKVKITDGTDDATVRDVTAAKALDVAIVDGAGAQITSFGGGTQYTEGDTDATITGTAAMWEDAADTLRVVSATKPLPVNLANTAANSTALKVDGSAVTQPVSFAPVTSGGLTISRTISAASTNATSVKASAGQVYGWMITSTDATPVYVKLYNKASSPTVGTDTPVMTLMVPGNSAGAGVVAAEFTMGIPFATGIALAITTGATDADTGAVAANEVIVNLFYK